MRLRLHSRLDNYNPYPKSFPSIIFTCHGHGLRPGPAELIDFPEHKISKNRWRLGTPLGLLARDFCAGCKRRPLWCSWSCRGHVKNSSVETASQSSSQGVVSENCQFSTCFFFCRVCKCSGDKENIGKALLDQEMDLYTPPTYSIIQFPRVDQQLENNKRATCL